MPRSLPLRPRKIFPPPTTMTISTPSQVEWGEGLESGEVPACLLPHLLNCRFANANLESNEAANADLVAELPGHAGDMFLHSNLVILFCETLVEQTVRLKEFFKLA